MLLSKDLLFLVIDPDVNTYERDVLLMRFQSFNVY